MKEVFCVKKFSVWAIFIFFLYILQTSVFSELEIQNVSVNLMLLFVVAFTLQKGNRLGAYVGFGTGLLQDLASGTFFGVNTFANLIVGFICGSFSESVYKEKFVLPLVSTLSMTALHYAIWIVIVLLLKIPFNLIEHLRFVLLPTMIWHALFTLPMYLCVEKITGWLDKEKFQSRVGETVE